MKQRLGCRPAVPPRAGPCEGPEAARGRVPHRMRSGEWREKGTRPRTLWRVVARDAPERRGETIVAPYARKRVGASVADSMASSSARRPQAAAWQVPCRALGRESGRLGSGLYGEYSCA